MLMKPSRFTGGYFDASVLDNAESARDNSGGSNPGSVDVYNSTPGNISSGNP